MNGEKTGNLLGFCGNALFVSGSVCYAAGVLLFVAGITMTFQLLVLNEPLKKDYIVLSLAGAVFLLNTGQSLLVFRRERR